MTVMEEVDQVAGRCGTVRASLLYRAPIFSEMGSCVLGKGMKGTIRIRGAGAGT